MQAAALRALPLLVLLALWQAATATRLVDPDFLPTVTSIARALGDLLSGGEIADNLFISLWRSFAGLAIGAVVGVLIGVGMAVSRAVEGFFDPLVKTTYSLPKSSLIPLFILWFGIGDTTPILAVVLASLLPVVVYAYHGVKAVPAVVVWSAQAMGTPRWRLVLRVLLPAALHPILTGVRIALGFSFVLTISSEMIAAKAGIGKLIFMYGENGAYDYMFAALAAVIAIAYIADRAFYRFSRWLLRWHESAAAEERPL